MSGDSDDRAFIQRLVAHTGLSPSETATRAGLAVSTLTRPLNHPVQYKLSKATIDKLRKAYPDFEDWSHPGVDDKSTELDDVVIEEWDVRYGMGAGGYVDLPVTGTPHTFSRSFLRKYTDAPPNKVFIATGTGDSMSPTILDSDSVIIDTSDSRLMVGDKIWAIAYGQTGMIKRLRSMPDGSVKILSDNPSVPPEVAYDGELHIVGRIVGIIRKT